MDGKNLHAKHRERMKSSMLSHGIDGLADHQVLEILLFYGIPRVDTNDTAHLLIERFGSLRGVLEADYDELLKVKGIGDNSASLIKFSQLLAGRYYRSTCLKGKNVKRFEDTDSLREYFNGILKDSRNEQVRAMAVDDDLRLISEGVIIEGAIGKVEVNMRRIVDFAVRCNCTRIVLAHNHPNGPAMPSPADISVTNEIAGVLEKLDIKLLDHIIVGKTGCLSMRASNSGLPAWCGGDSKSKNYFT